MASAIPASVFSVSVPVVSVSGVIVRTTSASWEHPSTAPESTEVRVAGVTASMARALAATAAIFQARTTTQPTFTEIIGASAWPIMAAIPRFKASPIRITATGAISLATFIEPATSNRKARAITHSTSIAKTDQRRVYPPSMSMARSGGKATFS